MAKSLWKRKKRDIVKFIGTAVTTILVLVWAIAKKKWDLDPILKEALPPQTEIIILYIAGYSVSTLVSNLFAQDELIDRFEETEKRLEETDKKIDAYAAGIKTAISNSIPLISRGKTQEARIEVIKKFSYAINVYNTCINTIQNEDYWRNYTNSHFHEEVTLYVKTFVENPESHAWVDLFSEKTKIRSNMIKNKIGDTRKYSSRLIKANTPIINFIIIEYPNETKEIFFGWGLHEREEIGRVFSSTNDRLIDTFQAYFFNLSGNEYSNAL